MPRNDSQRLTELETMLAHQDRMLAELSDVLRRQWAEIEALKLQLARLDASKADAPNEPDDRPPPHY
ncbi:MAG: SlyX family protein [Proteobacteria bacterium]|nr:SlyX family protein [Pseudomonadota bacterium]